MAIPVINTDDATNRGSGIIGRFQAADLIWSDEFEGDTIKADRWHGQQFVNDRNGGSYGRSLGQVNVDGHDDAGNVHLNPDGTPDQNYKPQGKRHAAWYNAYRSQCQYVRDGRLYLAGYSSTDTDPTIDVTNNIPGRSFKAHPYYDPRPTVDETVDLRNKVYTGWVQGYRAMSEPGTGNKIIDDQSPRQIFRYGYYEFDVDFTLMEAGIAHRVSAWLMPACKPTTPDVHEQNVTYDGTAATGAEVDVFEYENANSGNANQWLLMKVIDGTPKSFAPGTDPVVASDFGFDARNGTHTIGVWWKPDGMHFFLNGVEVNRDTARIPKIGQSIFLTREANTGVYAGRPVVPYPPYRQSDPGLYNDNVGRDPAAMNRCKASFGYVRVWQDPTLDGVASDPDTNWRHSATDGMVDPDTPGGDESGNGTQPGTSDRLRHIATTSPVVDDVQTGRRFTVEQYVTPSVEDAGLIECRVVVVDNPFEQSVNFRWEHGFTGATVAEFDDPLSPSTWLRVEGVPPDELHEIRCVINLGAASVPVPELEMIALAGTYVIR